MGLRSGTKTAYSRYRLSLIVGTKPGDWRYRERLLLTLRAGDATALADRLERALLDSVSYHDLRDENSCHMWLLSLLYGMPGYGFPRSNREVGRGRPDIITEPDAAHGTQLPAIVCEVKFAKDADAAHLQAVADAAVDAQALPLRYAHGLSGAGAILWGIAFDAGKHVAVSARTRQDTP